MIYSKAFPYCHAQIVNRYCLTNPGLKKQTWHVVIDISGSELTYRPGDSIGVMACNPPELVKRVMTYFKLDPDKVICDPRTGQGYTLFTWLSKRVDISTMSEQLFELSLNAAHSHHEVQKAKQYFETIQEEEKTATQQEVVWYKGIDCASFFETFFPSGATIDCLLPGFIPIRPRFYSIASSPLLSAHLVDLVVAKVEYSTFFGPKTGLCSNYLTSYAPLLSKEISIFIQPTKHFLLPSDDVLHERPIIMIGPGTGVAPFRAFMQHITQSNVQGSLKAVPSCWLFFGNRHRKLDFLYEEFWHELMQKEYIKLDAAFSRDNTEKEYVQHKMWQVKSQLFDWLYTKDGYLYVCGDAKKMAKDVESMLVQIAMSETNMSLENAFQWLTQMRQAGRYKKDVY